MQILLCAATTFEIQPVINMIQGGALEDTTVAITGVGMMAACYHISEAVHRKGPDFILQAGIAGCLNQQLPLGSVVMVENDTVGDLGVIEMGSFVSAFDMGLADDAFPWTERKLKNDLSTFSDSGLPVVDGVTVNEISTVEQRIHYYRDHLNASIETMEGAALHYVALQQHIPFLQLRAVSNYIGERDKSRWMMEKAIEQLNVELKQLLIKRLTK